MTWRRFIISQIELLRRWLTSRPWWVIAGGKLWIASEWDTIAQRTQRHVANLYLYCWLRQMLILLVHYFTWNLVFYMDMPAFLFYTILVTTRFRREYTMFRTHGDKTDGHPTPPYTQKTHWINTCRPLCGVVYHIPCRRIHRIHTFGIDRLHLSFVGQVGTMP